MYIDDSGIKEGLYEEWYDSGKYKTKCMYENGQKNALEETWHENGEQESR